jgi:hypothetical protein
VSEFLLRFGGLLWLVGKVLKTLVKLRTFGLLQGLESRVDDMNRMDGMLAGLLILTHCI